MKQARRENVSLAKKAKMVFRRLAGKSWGCNPQILHWMYTMILRPRLTYGSIPWTNRTDLITSRKCWTTYKDLPKWGSLEL